MKWLRYFDLEYWRLREALGYPVPSWVDKRWPRSFAGNGGINPFECGACGSRRLYPHLYPCEHEMAKREMTNISQEIGDYPTT